MVLGLKLMQFAQKNDGMFSEDHMLYFPFSDAVQEY
jgi:hypothetical protein